MSTPSELIESYLAANAGKSSYLDAQLRLTQQAILDADRATEQNDQEFAIINLAIARTLVINLIQIVTPFSEPIRRDLIEIYLGVDDSICDGTDRKKATLLDS